MSAKKRIFIGVLAYIITQALTISISNISLKISQEYLKGMMVFQTFLFSALVALLVVTYLSYRAKVEEMSVMTYRDALEGDGENESYHKHMEDLSSKKLPYGLIYIDLDDFRGINNEYGHEVGDALLSIVAKRLKNSIRDKDRVFKAGGDEFAVVIHGTHDKKFYEGVISRMRQNVSRDIVIGETSITVTMCAGYSRCPEDSLRIDDIVKRANDAMYYNKKLLKAKEGEVQ